MENSASFEITESELDRETAALLREVQAAGFVVERDADGRLCVVWEDLVLPLKHPFALWLMIYRDHTGVEERVRAMKELQDMLWPAHRITWNHWSRRRFEAHCSGYEVVVMAAGASAGKSCDAAKIGLIFWLSDPRNNTCIVASTTLESLESRIWGYVARFFSESVISLNGVYFRGKPPKILLPDQTDKIHGMFAVAIPQGADATVLKTVIGRHPNKRLLVVLDEATDMNPAISKAIPNLEEGVEFFQLWAIGNSSSKNDLHGALATPAAGWENIDPFRDYAWFTEHKGGLCLYFNPYDSPAIIEHDPVRRAELSKFLITTDKIEKKIEQYGRNSDAWQRFVMGFWGSGASDRAAITEPFLTENQVDRIAEWSGFYPLSVVAGLDPAFQVGGEGCLLRLGILGQTVDGMVVLDFRGDELVFRIDIRVDDKRSSERQLVDQVIQILREHGCRLSSLALDATGLGRALGELLEIVDGRGEHPFKLLSTRTGVGIPGARRGKKAPVDPYVSVVTITDLWLSFRSFIQNGQIRGVDKTTRVQLVNRLMTLKNDKLFLETKEDYKRRMGAISPGMSRSPDESDAMMLCVQAAIMRYGWHPGQRRALPDPGVSRAHLEKERAFAAEMYQRKEQEERSATTSSRPILRPDFAATLEEIRFQPRLR